MAAAWLTLATMCRLFFSNVPRLDGCRSSWPPIATTREWLLLVGEYLALMVVMKRHGCFGLRQHQRGGNRRRTRDRSRMLMVKLGGRSQSRKYAQEGWFEHYFLLWTSTQLVALSAAWLCTSEISLCKCCDMVIQKLLRCFPNPTP